MTRLPVNKKHSDLILLNFAPVFAKGYTGAPLQDASGLKQMKAGSDILSTSLCSCNQFSRPLPDPHFLLGRLYERLRVMCVYTYSNSAAGTYHQGTQVA